MQSYIKSQNVFGRSKIIYYNDIVDVINHNFTNCFVKREIASPKREESETETDCSSDLALHDNREYSLEDSNCSSGNEHENALSSEMAESKSKCPEDGTDNYRFDVQGITDTNILQKTDEAFKKCYLGHSNIYIKKFVNPSMDNQRNDNNDDFEIEGFKDKTKQKILDLYKPGEDDDLPPLLPGETPGFICAFCHRRYIKRLELVKHLHDVHAEMDG